MDARLTVARAIIGVTVGFLAAAMVVGILEAAGHVIYPPPPGIDLHTAEQLKSIIDKLPRGALIAVLFAWTAGSFTGGLVATLISNKRTLPAIIVGSLQLLCGIATMLIVPHPAWFVVTSVVILIPSAWLGALLANSLRRSPPTAGPQPYDMREKNMAC